MSSPITPSNKDSSRSPKACPDGPHHNDRAFQSFLIDQLSTIQEQNEYLKARVTRLEKEQEEFYISGQKKMEVGFKHVAKCSEDVTAMKEIFKEIVGIMTGERVRFMDHSQENVSREEAAKVSSSTLLASNSKKERQERRQQYDADYSALTGGQGIKTEDTDRNSSLLYGPTISAPISSDTRGARVFDLPLTRRSRFVVTGDGQNDEDAGSHVIGNISDNETSSHENSIPNGNIDSNYSENFTFELAMNYKMNRAIQSVHDVAREYFEGLPGLPSLMFLERRYGSTWRRSAKERTLFAKRMSIVNKINDVRKNASKYGLPEKTNRNMAIKVVENIRLGNNDFKGHHCRLSLSQLYTYFSKKMDKQSDYSMTLKNRGEPRRMYLMREREARLERNSPGESSVDTETTSAVPTGSTSEGEHLP